MQTHQYTHDPGLPQLLIQNFDILGIDIVASKPPFLSFPSKWGTQCPAKNVFLKRRGSCFKLPLAGTKVHVSSSLNATFGPDL